jgi:hypothetical protein
MTLRRLTPFLLALLALAACRPATPEDPVAVGPPAEEPRDYAEAVVGTYEASLPAASGVGRHVALALREDGSATMETDYRNNEAPIRQLGTWDVEGERVVVMLTDQDGRPVEERLAFARTGDDLALVDYDPAAYGSEGLTLRRTSVY